MAVERGRSYPSDPSYKFYDDKEPHRADRRAGDSGDEADAEIDAKSRQQPASDEGADDADKDIADKAEAAASDQFSGEPACDQPHQKNDQNCLTGHYDSPCSNPSADRRGRMQ